MSRSRRYFPVLVALVLASAQVIIAAEAALDAACAEGCGSDDDSGHCPPSCLCGCCHAPRQQSVSQVMLGRLEVPPRTFGLIDVVLPASPDPEPLFHVPKQA